MINFATAIARGARAYGWCVVAGLGLGYLLVTTVFEKGVSWFDRGVAFAIALASGFVFVRIAFPNGVTARTGRARGDGSAS